MLSIVFCIALAVMWVRSYWRYDAVDYWSAHPNARQMMVGIISDGGHILISIETRSCENSPPREARTYLLPPGFHRGIGPPTDLWRRFINHPVLQPRSMLGVAYLRFPFRGAPIVTTYIACSFIWLLLVAALLPVTQLARISLRIVQRRTRRRQNRCEARNYSLAHNASGVCPECGTARLISASGEPKNA